jgi:tetratricopeptide (TPR) repeat protein
MNPPAGSLIAFATDAGRVARDGDGPNGLYTGELLKNLGTPGLTIEQVFKRTRAAVMERSGGTQIPAEYSRLVGEDVYLAGSTPAPPPPPPKAEPVTVPSAEAINRLARSGDAAACAEALFLTAATRGPGGYAVAPLETILDQVKEDLKDATGPSPKVELKLRACDSALAVIARCLPPGHPQAATLSAKARNRRGDCLLLLGKPGDALADYHAAIELAPDDAYPLYNRGRAHLALGHKDEAVADFTAAASDRFKQAGARRLAQQALRELQGATGN